MRRLQSELSPLRRVIAFALPVLLLAIAAAAPADAQQQAAPLSPCASPMPIAELSAGMTGVGYTVERGRQPQPFDVEILGVLPNAVAPGRDMIVIDTDSAAMRRAGGIWSGMSGSPVYIGNRLVGAIAFGLSAGPSSIGALTPAQDMLDILAYPDQAAAPTPKRVSLSPSMTDIIAKRTARPASQVGGLVQIPTPLGVSGLPAATLSRLQAALDRPDRPLIPFQAAAAPPPDAATIRPATIAPGDNFAGVISYGDVTTTGIGTTTYVCNDRVLALGHPFLFSGPTTLGANAATAVAVVDDNTFGPFKVATLDGFIGTVDQDRLAGIGSTIGSLPTLIPITSTVTAEGRSRTGRTDLTVSDQLPFVALSHLAGNATSVYDRTGEGTAKVGFSLRGVDAQGRAFRLNRDNLFSSRFDVGFESAFELLSIAGQLQDNPFTGVTFTSLDADVEITPGYATDVIGDVLISPDGENFVPSSGQPLFVEPGQTIIARVNLKPFRGEQERTVDLALVIPGGATGSGVIDIAGGSNGQLGDPFGCVFDPSCPTAGTAADDFFGLVDQLENQPRNNDLVATLQIFPCCGGPFGSESSGLGPDEAFVGSASVSPFAASQQVPPPVPPQPGPEPGPTPPTPDPQPPLPPSDPLAPIVVRTTARQDRVVTGSAFAPIELLISQELPQEAGLLRVAGANRAQTASSLSQAFFPASDAVVVASGDQYGDALSAAPLAGLLGAPVLLAGAEGLNDQTAAEVTRLGATQAILVGGTAALPQQVEQDLQAAGIQRIERIAGPNRFATAALVIQRLSDEGVSTGRVYIAQGADPDPQRGWPDAVAVSGLAAAQVRPILLTDAGRLPDETNQAIDDFLPVEATIVGGTAAISQDIVTQVESRGVLTQRLSGADRYATSAEVAEITSSEGFGDPNLTFFVTGRSFADALAAGPAAAAAGGVLLLLDGQGLDGSPPARAWVARNESPQRVVLVGGPAAISTAVEDELAGIVYGGGPATGG